MLSPNPPSSRPPLSLPTVRDGLGTGLYFGFNEVSRAKLGRLPTGEQGPAPPWLPIPATLIPFFCGAASGVLSWALVYREFEFAT